LIDKSNSKKLTVDDPGAIQFRTLAPADGMALHRLVRECPPLDTNSTYCNMLQCSHFLSTSIAAFFKDDLVGSITGYCVPDRPDSLFIWQVAVHPSFRGRRLARTMLQKLVQRKAAQGVRFVETSITQGNTASWNLFTGFATALNANCVRSVLFDQSSHFERTHDTEHLVRIGPIILHNDDRQTNTGGTI
jgi:diaminobutyrate acetyltransferase